jgi:hypothetical protein
MAHGRRAVLKVAALAGTAFFVPLDLLEAFQRQPAREPAPLGADNLPIGTSRLPITRSFLQGHVSTDFLVQTPGGLTLTLQLVEVADLPNAAASGQEGSEEAFAARFTDASGILLSQGTYTLNHARLGRLWWFLVPVDQPGGRLQVYEAIFNSPAVTLSPPKKIEKPRLRQAPGTHQRQRQR